MNQSNLSQWRQSTNLIFWGILILSLCGWIASFLGYFTGVADIIDGFYSAASQISGKPKESMPFVSGFYTAYYLFQTITLAGWAMYLAGLSKFRSVQPTENTRRFTGRLNTACWLGVAAIVIGLINGMMNWIFMILFMVIGWVLTLISYITFMNAFGELKHCEEWNGHAQSGAGKLRLSASLNIWLIFWPVICLAVALIIGGSAWQHAKYIYSNAGEYVFANGIGGIFDTMENYKGIAIASAIILGLSGLVLSITQFILRLTGWRTIHNGFIREESYESAHTAPGTYPDGFCHRCGTPLERDASFCHVCGERTVVSSTGQNIPDSTETPASCEPDNSPEGDEESEPTGNKKKIILWCGIAGGAILLLALVWFAFIKPRLDEANAKTAYVYLWSTIIYESTNGDEGINELATPKFGEWVNIIHADYKSGWGKVAYETASGENVAGYCRLNDLADFMHFTALKQAGFDKEYVQGAIQAQSQRKAVMEYFNLNSNDSIKSVSENPEGVCAYATLVDGEEVFAFIVGKKYDADELVVYKFNENKEPEELSREKAPEDASGIKDINGDLDNINVTYLYTKDPAYSVTGTDSEPVYAGQESNEPESAESLNVYKGTINNKYAIEMTLNTDGGAYYSGEYFYTKNKTPIQLRGRLIDDYEHLVLEEYVGLNKTGSFNGILTRYGYSGTWTSSDGNTSYPFCVSRH